MMVQIALIGIGAGAAATLLFASVISGSAVAVVLFYLAPLPILIAAIGWSHWAGLVAAITSSLSVGVVFGAFFSIAFLVSIGLPAWWLGYLTLLARPTATPERLEWYPVGRLVLWTAVLGALTVTAVIPHFGSDQASFHAALKGGFERVMRLQMGTPKGEPLTIPDISDPDRLLEFLALIIPPAAAVVSTMTQIANLWLAGRIVKVSGRLTRPWPDLSAMIFPPAAVALLAASLAGSFLPGLTGIVCTLFAASLLFVYALLGFAVLHALTRPLPARFMILASVYALVLVFSIPLLLIMLLGLIEMALNLRKRMAKHSPPAMPTS